MKVRITAEPAVRQAWDGWDGEDGDSERTDSMSEQIKIGTKVRTADPLTARGYTREAETYRRAGAEGVVQESFVGELHGYRRVLHDDGTVGSYDNSELTPIDLQPGMPCPRCRHERAR